VLIKGSKPDKTRNDTRGLALTDPKVANQGGPLSTGEPRALTDNKVGDTRDSKAEQTSHSRLLGKRSVAAAGRLQRSA
jgi:hypothetical protein